MGLFDEIRRACAAVAAQATQVHIDYGRIPAYAASLPLEQATCPALDPATHYLGHGEGTLAFLVTLDAVNFGSGYFPHLRKRPGMSGYFTIASGLNDHFHAHGPLSAGQLAALTPADCACIFGQHGADATAGELMELFSTALQDLGRLLLERYGGSFAALVEAAGGSAEALVRTLVAMPYYNDVEAYDGLAVPFYKRAQITSADLWLAFAGEGWGRFDDIDSLTIFADNLVPHVLRMDGILAYSEDLTMRIGREELVPAGSPAEVEMRASAVHAVELIASALAAQGHGIPPRKLDYLLWNRGHEPRYKAHPRHRTRTVYY